MQKAKRILFYWFIGYMVLTSFGVAHTIFNGVVLGMPAMPVDGVSYTNESMAYAATVPWHPIYNLVFWPIMGVFYLKKTDVKDKWREMLKIGGVWAGISFLLDMVGWVLIPHPLQMSAHDFYIDYQPWITFVYLTILLSPQLSALWMSRRKHNKTI